MTLEELSTAIIARLTGDAYFQDVPVTDSAAKDLAARYAEQTGRLKVHVLLQMTGVPKLESEAPQPYATAGLTFLVRENWAVNRGAGGTGKTAQAIAQKITKLLWLWPLAGSGGCVKVTGLTGLTEAGVAAWDVTAEVPWAM